MRFNLLSEALPESVTIGGKNYPIRWDFRVGIQVEAIVRSEKSDIDKYEEILRLYYPTIPSDLQAAMDQAMWFYRCGEDKDPEEKDRRRYMRRSSKGPAWVFTQDAPYIYAAFKEQYGMDLTEKESLHWWKFMALFESLGEDTKMSKIMYYRQVNTSGMSKAHRAFINEMKKHFQIRETGKKMTLEQRNQRWIRYIEDRYSQGKA